MWLLAWIACSPAPSGASDGPAACAQPTDDTPSTSTPSASTPGSSDTASGEPGAITWDTSPIDVPEGTEITALISCSLLDGLPEILLARGKDPWRWEITDNQGATPAIPECTSLVLPNVLLWESEPTPRLTVITGGISHVLAPTPVEGLWAGTALPFNGSSPECDAALAEQDLGWPIQLTITIDPNQGS